MIGHATVVVAETVPPAPVTVRLVLTGDPGISYVLLRNLFASRSERRRRVPAASANRALRCCSASAMVSWWFIGASWIDL
jgi:hypothetical protein